MNRMQDRITIYEQLLNPLNMCRVKILGKNYNKLKIKTACKKKLGAD
jgi:hypothetical protein